MFYERFCGSEPKLRQTVAVLPWGGGILWLWCASLAKMSMPYFTTHRRLHWKVGIVNFCPVQSQWECTQGKPIRRTIISSRRCLPHRQCSPTRYSEAAIIWDSLAWKPDIGDWTWSSTGGESIAIPFGTWQRLHIYRQSVCSGIQRKAKQSRYVLLPSWIALSCGDWLEDWWV